jgi:hypothetical protein
MFDKVWERENIPLRPGIIDLIDIAISKMFL